MNIKSITFTKDYKMFKAKTKFTFSKDEVSIIAGSGGSGKSTLLQIVKCLSSSKDNSFKGNAKVEYFKTRPDIDPLILDDAFCILNYYEIGMLFGILKQYVYKLNMQVIITVRTPFVDNDKFSNANWIRLH